MFVPNLNLTIYCRYVQDYIKSLALAGIMTFKLFNMFCRKRSIMPITHISIVISLFVDILYMYIFILIVHKNNQYDKTLIEV